MFFNTAFDIYVFSFKFIKCNAFEIKKNEIVLNDINIYDGLY